MSLRSRLDKLEDDTPPLPEIHWPNLWAKTAAELRPDAQGIDWWIAFRSGQLPSKYRERDPVTARIAAVRAMAKPAAPTVTNPTSNPEGDNL